jgi:translation elongation factor EF-Ts
LKKRTDALKKNIQNLREQSEAEVKEQKGALKLQIDNLKQAITDLRPIAKVKQQENKDNN